MANKTMPKGNVDDETLSAIYNGLNQSQFMKLFRCSNVKVQQAIFESGAKPTGNVRGFDLYSVYDLAPYLVRPVGDFEAYIRKMNHEDLPKQLTKEFWAGLRSRQEYLEKAGHLWSTEKVVQEVGELFKIMKMQALLARDAVDRQTELSPRQRQIITSLMDGMLANLIERINSRFRTPDESEKAAADKALQEHR